MTKQETKKTIDAMAGIHQLIIKLMYGSGLRVTECVRLRVKDLDFEVKSAGMNLRVPRQGNFLVEGAREKVRLRALV